MKRSTIEPRPQTEDAAVAERLAGATRWRALSLLLAPPRSDLPELLSDLARSLPGADGSALAAIAALARADPGSLWARHHRVLGAGGHCPAGETDLLPSPLGAKGGTLGDISAFYRAFHFDPAAEWSESPDHAATECAFAAWLELKRAYARARGAGEEEAIAAGALERFAAAHLAPCLDALVPRLAAADPEGLYTRVAELAARAAAAVPSRSRPRPTTPAERP